MQSNASTPIKVQEDYLAFQRLLLPLELLSPKEQTNKSKIMPISVTQFSSSRDPEIYPKSLIKPFKFGHFIDKPNSIPETLKYIKDLRKLTLSYHFKSSLNLTRSLQGPVLDIMDTQYNLKEISQLFYK